MAAFWRNLSDRERMLVMIGGMLAIAFVALQFILSPALSWRADQKRALENARGVYELVAQVAPLGGASPSGVSASDSPVRNIVSQSASSAGVAIVFINARGDNAVDVNIAAVEPGLLFDWLGRLRTEHNIVVDNADIARETGNPEVVRAQLAMSGRGTR